MYLCLLSCQNPRMENEQPQGSVRAKVSSILLRPPCFLLPLTIFLSFSLRSSTLAAEANPSLESSSLSYSVERNVRCKGLNLLDWELTSPSRSSLSSLATFYLYLLGQILFYPNAGGSANEYCSLYLSCEPSPDEYDDPPGLVPLTSPLTHHHSSSSTA